MVDELGAADLALTAAEVAAAGALWLALLGLADDGSAAARAARAEAADDVALCVSLHRPAGEFLSWWRAAAWEDFGRDGDAWAWSVCDAARRGCTELGPWLAGQIALTADLVRRSAGRPL